MAAVSPSSGLALGALEGAPAFTLEVWTVLRLALGWPDTIRWVLLKVVLCRA